MAYNLLHAVRVGPIEVQELFTSGVDYLEIFDGAHSDEEERFIAVGPVQRGIVVVVWVERVEDVVRIISARFATPNERGLFALRFGEKP